MGKDNCKAAVLCDSAELLRFEKLFSPFLDGIPRPFITVSTDARFGETFGFSFFGITPDHTNKTEVVYFPEFRENELFHAICVWENTTFSPSSRIGSHYSPYVGTFCFCGKGHHVSVTESRSKRRPVRVPIAIDEKNSTPTRSGRDFRTSLLIDLYEKMAIGFISHDRDSLRRIVILATQGANEGCKDIVKETVDELEKGYVRVIVHAIYDYLCQNSLFRRIISPLKLLTREEVATKSGTTSMVGSKAKRESLSGFNTSLAHIKSSLFWSSRTNPFFMKLHDLWLNTFDRLVIFNTTAFNWRTGADDFLSQLECSLRAAFTRIRIGFYTDVERILFTHIPRSNELLSMSSETFRESDLSRLFTTVRVFLCNRLRILMDDAISDLVSFLAAGGDTLISPTSARKIPLIEVHFTIGESGLPTSSSFAQLYFGIASLLDELFETANNLPTPETVIMRTIMFERKSLSSFDRESFPVKSVLWKYIAAACTVVEELMDKYSAFATIPVLNGIHFSYTTVEDIISHANLLRKGISAIGKVSPDVVFCGCIAINCSEIKKWYTKQWSSYLKGFLSVVHKDILSFLNSSLESCHRYNEQLMVVPSSVEELEKLQMCIRDAEALREEVGLNHSRRVCEYFEYLERLLIPVDPQLYEAAIKLVNCPQELHELTTNAKEVCKSRRPALIEKLGEYRSKLRGKIEMVSSGVTELLGLLGIDVCDICAQTCQELRVIVDDVIKGIDYVFYCEKSLEMECVDNFENAYPWLRVFDVLEQFWGSIFDSTRVKEYYRIPVNALNSEKVIDEVQRCRRLLHCSVRNLRGYPGLVCLGRQQEKMLADFESLQTLLMYLATPGLRKNHWKEIGRLLQLDRVQSYQVDSSVSLKQLLENGITDHIDELRLIVDPARLDFEAEAALEHMKSEAKKTRFIFECIEKVNGALILSPECRKSIFLQLNSFLGELSTLRQIESLSPYAMNSVLEFESFVERLKGTFITWEDIENEWVEVMRFGLTLEYVGEGEATGISVQEQKLLSEKILTINDTFKTLAMTLQKAQYTLFTAMIQENIQDHFAVARTVLTDIQKIISSSLGAKREAFPRFYFLDDASMLSFLSVHDVPKLKRHLAAMYSKVCDVGLEGSTITSFITSDGFTMKATTPIGIFPQPVEHWMKAFDTTLRSSLLHDIKTSVEDHYHTDTITWLTGSCVQVVDVALRIVCNRDLREAISIAGTAGVGAYARRSRDILDEYVRLAEEAMAADTRLILSGAIVFLLQHREELRLVTKSGVETVDELNTTPIVQTLLSGDKIAVQIMGFQVPYGMEVLGNYNLPVLTPEFVERALYNVLLSFKASYFPLITGGTNENFELEYYAQYLGRFCWFLQSHRELTLDGILRGLRGCLSTGAVFCLKDVELLNKDIVDKVAELLRAVELACRDKSGRLDGGTTTVEFQAGDTFLYVPKDPCFHAVLTAGRLGEIPTALSLAFRPIFMPQVDLTLLAQGTLQSLGFPQFINIGQRLSVMFSQLNDTLPTTFTIKGFLTIIRRAVACGEGTMAENLCTALLSQYWHAVHSDDRLWKLFEWNVIHTLGIPDHMWLDALEKFTSKSGFGGVLERFTLFMNFNRNVILLGSVYSGSLALWKSWAGDAHCVVLSHRLLTSKEMYGDDVHPGILASLAKSWDPLIAHTIVIEHANLSNFSSFFDGSGCVRIPSHSGPDFIPGSLTYLINIATSLDGASPRTIGGAAIFTLPDPVDWKEVLSRELHREPNHCPGVAFTVMSTIIQVMLDKGFMVNLCMQNEDLFGVACRCSKLYKRWYIYSRTNCSAECEYLTEDVFASQCAVFATAWSLMLQMQAGDIPVVTSLFKDARDLLIFFLRKIKLDEDSLLPPDEDLLNYVATPFGWRKLGSDSNEVGLTVSWALKFPELDPGQPAWTYSLPLLSRQRTLTHLECLTAAGQPVLVVGGRCQGKSTILSHMLRSKRWACKMVHNTTAYGPTRIQEGLLRSLSRTTSDLYTPSGQVLVLCVDDVHLAEGDNSHAMCLFGFIDRYSALCTPSVGYARIGDVVCVGSTLPTFSYEPEEENAVLRLRLPDFVEDELVAEVGGLITKFGEMRRGEEFCKRVNNFVVAAHHAAFNFINARHSEAHLDNNRAKSVTESLNTACELDEISILSFSDHKTETLFRLSYFRMLLRVTDSVMRILSTQLEDVDVIRGMFDAVCSSYMPLIKDDSHREELEADLLKIVSDTMQCTHEEVLCGAVDGPYIVERLKGIESLPVSKDIIRGWVEGYDEAVSGGHIDEESASNPEVTARLVPSAAGKAWLDSAASKWMRLSESSNGTVRREPVSYWTASLISDIHHCLRQQGTHVALIGPYGVGIRRALHIWVSAQRANATFFGRGCIAPGEEGKFKEDLADVLHRTCRGGGRMVVFIPHEVLSPLWPLSRLYAALCGGEVKELFAAEEQAYLLHGRRVVQRQNGKLTAAEEEQLQRRISSRLSIVAHFTSLEEMSRVSVAVPFVLQMLPVTLRTHDMLREHIDRAIDAEKALLVARGREKVDGEDGSKGFSRRSSYYAPLLSAEFPGLLNRPYSQLLCDIFSDLQTRMGINVECLDEFVTQTQRLRSFLCRANDEISQLLKIEGLPATILEKAEEYSNRSKQAEESRKEFNQKHKDLGDKLRKCEDYILRHGNETGLLQRKVKSLQLEIKEAEQTMQGRMDLVKKNLSSAKARLTAVRITQIKQFAGIMPTNKVTVLVKVISKVLGQDIPMSSLRETWERGKDIVTSPKFIAHIKDMNPDDFSYDSFANLYLPLRGIRFGESVPFGDALVGFLVAFMDAVRVSSELGKEKLQLDDTRRQLSHLQDKVDEASRNISEFKRKIAILEKEMSNAKEEARNMEMVMQDMAKRQRSLDFMMDVLDRFSLFHVPKETIKQEEEAKKGEGAVIAAAAHFALFAALPREARLNHHKVLRSFLNELGVPAPEDPEDPAVLLLYPSLKDMADNILLSACSISERVYIAALIQRIFLNCPYFCGTTAVFETVVKHCLTLMCEECVVVSVLQKGYQDAVIAAATSGSGLLLCDVHSLSLMKDLLPLLALLHTLPEAALTKKSVSCKIFDQTVEIKPTFFMTCVSSAPPSHEEVMYAARYRVVVINLDERSNLEEGARVVLLGSPTAYPGLLERDVFILQDKQEGEALCAFRDTLQEVRVTLSGDIDDLASNKDGVLERLDFLLRELHNLHMIVLRIVAQRKNMQKPWVSLWDGLQRGIRSAEGALSVIEGDILGRCWTWRKLEPFIFGATKLSQPLVRRISPNVFDKLPIGQKNFYATANFLESVVESMACGWPGELRGIFAWYVFSSVANGCRLLASFSGQLYNSNVAFHTVTQFEVLDRLIRRASNPVTKEMVKGFYAASTDSILTSIASDDSPSKDRADMQDASFCSPSGSPNAAGALKTDKELIFNLFRQWMCLNYRDCNKTCSNLYEGFFSAIKRKSADDDESYCIYDALENESGAFRCADGWAHACRSTALPLLLNGGNMHELAYYVRHQADKMKFSYRFLRVAKVWDFSYLMRYVYKCFHRSPINHSRGYCVMAVFVPPTNAKDEELLLQTIARKFSVMRRYGVCGSLRAGCPSRIPVFLFCAVYSASGTSRGALTNLMQQWCISLVVDSCLPRYHLLTVLESTFLTQPWKREGLTLFLGEEHKCSATSLTLSDTVRKSEREEPVLIPFGNVIELHAGICANTAALRAEVEAKGFCNVLQGLYQVSTTIDDLGIILLILSRANSGDGLEPHSLQSRSVVGAPAAHTGLSLRNTDFQKRVINERFYRLFNKVAYLVYTCRRRTSQGRFVVESVLHERGPMQALYDGRPCNSTVLEDVLKDGPTEEVLLATVRHSAAGFLHLCGDGLTVTAYRAMVDSVMRGRLYGIPFPLREGPTSLNTRLSVDAGGKKKSDDPLLPPDSAEVNSIISLLLPWEEANERGTLAALEGSGHRDVASRLRLAMTELKEWKQGSVLRLWIPALRHPKVLLNLLLADALEQKGDYYSSLEMSLVVTRRYTLLHDDILLVGATLSQQLEREISSHTMWDPSEMWWNKKPNAVEDENDVVIAVRFRKGCAEYVTQPSSELLWDLRRAGSVVEQNRDISSQRSNVLFLTEPNVSPSRTVEKRTLTPIPVVGVDLKSSAANPARPDTEQGNRMNISWQTLFELPLYVAYIAKQQNRPRRITSRSSAQMTSRGAVESRMGLGSLNPTSDDLGDSLGFFVAIL